MKNNCCDTNDGCGCNCNCNCSVDRSNKLCELTKPYNQFDVKEVLSLVDAPQYICRCCGRLANKEENLCNPIKLTK